MNLNQVTVAVTDVPRAIAFYRQLGLQLIVESLPDYARFCCPDGSATFSVSRVERVQPSQSLVYFECDELDATVQRLQALGVQFSMLPTDQPWLWREAYLSDPDGNPLCLYFAGSNRLDPPWRLT
ncbi:MAG: glyoxalase/bleomycin resistance/extradiol dioxygenase family protein [Pseudomonas sp. PGPPP3]|nr:MAG: glyoxalase/bleomycin resistance/extradiol dioxygenase family protein [Pseudomonas sp. PGPPP3]